MKYKLAFDTETGGLDPKKVDVLTLYACIVDEDYKILDEIDLKLKPDGGRTPVVEAQAMKINKIDLHAHLNNPETITYSEAKVKLVTMIEKYLKKKGRYSNITPLGQNVSFDIDFVQQHILPKEEWDSMIHYGKIDTKGICDFFKDCKWFPQELGTLESIVDFLQIPKRAAHNAKEDTLMTIDVYKEYLRMMESRKNAGQSQDLISLLEAE